MQILKHAFAILLATALVACGGGGGSPGTVSGGGSTTTTTTTSTTTPTTTTGVVTACSGVAQLLLQASAGIAADGGATSSAITATALDPGNARVAGATVTFAVSGEGILSVGTAATGSGGTATALVTAGAANQDSRVAVVTATCGSLSATANVQIFGATIALASPSTNVVVGGSTATLVATVKNAMGSVLPGATVTFASTDATVLSATPATGVTNSSGQISTTIAGVNAGTASITATSKGNVAARAFTAGTSVSSIAFTSPATNSIVVVGNTVTLSVSVPTGATLVTFATSNGLFSNGLQSISVGVSGGVATAGIAAPSAGSAVVDVVDNISSFNRARLQLTFTPATANKIQLNASQTTLGVSNASGVSSVILTAKALFFNGATDQSVANQFISFSQAGGPAAGENLDNALVLTDSNGVATATFFAGSAPSTPGGILVTALLASNTTVKATKSLTIGGQALSVALGAASVVSESTDKTYYLLAHSVQVTDAGNNPVKSQTVTLKLAPYAFSTGSACTVSATYCSEDKNGNGSLDPGEDGNGGTGVGRPLLPNDLSATSCSSATLVSSTMDGALTPPNSDAGSVPVTVTTDNNGIAGFQLVYLKANSIWVVPKLTATVSSNGTESSKSIIFRLPASIVDASTTTCLIPDSTYVK